MTETAGTGATVAAGESSASGRISADQFTVMTAVQASQGCLESPFAALKDEVRHGQEEAAAKAVKLARHEKPYTFQKKGNEEQATFNARVDETLAEAQADLPTAGTSPALTRAHQAIERGRKLNTERQKLIRLADRSELGWGVASEYTADELAENSEDEKRLEKAEKAAERKAVKRRKKQTAPRRTTRFLPPAPAVTAGPSSTQATYQMAKRPQTALLPVQRQPRVVGPCFACGEMGHIRSNCTKMAGTAMETRRWYPFCYGEGGNVEPAGAGGLGGEPAGDPSDMVVGTVRDGNEETLGTEWQIE